MLINLFLGASGMRKIFAVIFTLVIISGCLFDNNDNAKNGGGAGLTYSASGNLKLVYENFGDSNMLVYIPGVTFGITGSGISDQETTTGENGKFSFTGLPNGTYTLKESIDGYDFEPSSPSFTIKDGNLSGLIFKMVADSSGNLDILYPKISGTVRDSSGNVIQNVNLKILGAYVSELKTQFDSYGKYAFTVKYSGTYGVIPEKEGYDFTPAQRVIVVYTGEKITDADFVGQLSRPGYELSGSVKDISEKGVSGVTLTLSGSEILSKTFLTGSDGAYTFKNLSAGSYLLSISKENCSFSPATKTVTLSDANMIGQDFSLFAAGSETRTITGNVKTSYGVGIFAATLTLSGDGINSQTYITGSDGSFKFKGLPDGSYTITPEKSGFSFEPASETITVSGEDMSGVEFVGAEITDGRSATGFITTSDGVPIAEVTLEIKASGVNARTTVTAGDGSYCFYGLPDSTVYTITPKKLTYGFTPASITVSVRGRNQSGLDFKGASVTSVVKHSISGTVTGITGEGIPGVNVDLSSNNIVVNTYVTGSDGGFKFENLGNGNYKVTLNAAGYNFSNTYKNFIFNAGTSQNEIINFKGYVASQSSKISVSGHVYDYNNEKFPGITVTFTGDDTLKCVTDSNGYYLFENIAGDGYYSGFVYIKGESLADYFGMSAPFFPTGFGDITDLDIICSWIFSVSWRLIDSDGNAIPGAEVVFKDKYSEKAGVVVSESEKKDYTIKFLYKGKTNVTISKEGYTFSPDSLSFSLSRGEKSKDLGTIIGTKNP